MPKPSQTESKNDPMHWGCFDLRNGFADTFADGQTYGLTDGFPDGLAENFANEQKKRYDR
jgi:hypothetical protein